MKIVEGKYYRNRSGKKVGPAIWEGGHKEYPWNIPWDMGEYGKGDYFHYEDGRSCLGHKGDDIVAEWEDMPEGRVVVGTLSELGVQVGDVVRCVSDSHLFDGDFTCFGICGSESPFAGEYRLRGDAYGSGIFNGLDGVWKVVSRANETKEEEAMEYLTWDQMTSEEKGSLLLDSHEGKIIEYYSNLTCSWTVAPNPLFSSGNMYRVKPEPKVETITLYGNPPIFGSGPQIKSDTHKITFDTLDGEPDCNSVKMEKITKDDDYSF